MYQDPFLGGGDLQRTEPVTIDEMGCANPIVGHENRLEELA
jgi:hypothetical protein